MDRELLQHIVNASSQYDSTCRELAAQLLKAQDERDEAKARLAQFESAEEYDAQRAQPAGDEAKSIWRRILDKPHWALPEIHAVVTDRDEAKLVLEIMERDLRGRLELVTARLIAAEDRLLDVSMSLKRPGSTFDAFQAITAAMRGWTRTTERT